MTTNPSGWVQRFARFAGAESTVLDVACGSGRHANFFAGLGAKVTAVDRRPHGSIDPRVEFIEADLEDGGRWPLGSRRFDVVVVTRYLYRPLFPALIGAMGPEGVMIYETFARGNERFGKPSNPDFLLEPGELLERFRPPLHVVAYEHGEVAHPKPAVLQRICATRFDPGGMRLA